VEIYAEGDRVIIARSRPRYTLAALVEQITPENVTPEVDLGEPEGSEVW
jgi:antitoxin component of MazEF toxin-antitoxin module